MATEQLCDHHKSIIKKTFANVKLNFPQMNRGEREKKMWSHLKLKK